MRHPCFQVKFPVSCSAKLLSRHVQHPVRNLKRLEDLLLNIDHLHEALIRLLDSRSCEHLNFRKLMQPIQASRLLAFASFFAETVAERNVLQRQLILEQELVRMHASQRNLCCPNEAVVRVVGVIREQVVNLAR